MSVKAKKETLEFQTEARQILHLMTHSLYSNKEIFLRELVSNASDACDKLRFEAMGNDKLYEGDGELAIHVEFDKKKNTVSVIDNGIGMNRGELIENIGTIASSGTRKFLETLTGDQAKDAQMIGQFGVGFYSSFIVADKVEVISRKAGDAPDQAVHWESDGQGSYTIESTSCEKRGTEVIVHLRKDEKEFADHYRLRSVIKNYSDHISLPILMKKPVVDDKKGKEDAELETINSASALWTRPKKDISKEEYNEFYKQVSHDFQDPLTWTHNRVEGKQVYTSLLFIPKVAPFDLFDRDHKRGVKLYVKRIFIMDDAEHLMPSYLRFIKGVVDSDDLPLNVSREILQHNKLIDKIRAGSVKKVLGMLESMAKKKPEDYAEFWRVFGQVLKEGPIEDESNKERIAKLLRFCTTTSKNDEQTVSLEEYVERMQDGQDKIYYITAESNQAAKHSPHLEIFKSKGIEVLLLSERVDDWLVTHLTEFGGKTLQSVARGEIDLDDKQDKKDEKSKDKADKDFASVIERMKKSLGDKISEVRISSRLTDSPSCLVLGEHEMSPHMAQILKSAGQYVTQSQPALEINTTHALVSQLKDMKDDGEFTEWSELLFEQAMLAEGGQLEDPAGFVKRVNRMLAQS